MRTEKTAKRESWGIVALAALSVGVATWLAFLLAGIATRTRRWLIWAGVYFLGLSAALVVTRLDRDGPLSSLILTAIWWGGLAHALLIRSEYVRRRQRDRAPLRLALPSLCIPAREPERVGRRVGLGWIYYGQGLGNPLTYLQTLAACSLITFPLAVLLGLTLPAVPPKLEMTAALLFVALCNLSLLSIYEGTFSEGVYLSEKGVRITWGDLLPPRTRFFDWPEIKTFGFDGMQPFMETEQEFVWLPGVDEVAVTRPQRAERMLTAMNRRLAAEAGTPSAPETRMPEELTPDQTRAAKAKSAGIPTRNVFYLIGMLAMLGTGQVKSLVVVLVFVILAELIVWRRNRKIEARQTSAAR